jgi:AraC-like DNA-binding protein
MNALDGVLADLVEADRDCAYVTVKREPLEELIADWAGRGDRLSLFCGLLTRARNELGHASAAHRDGQLQSSSSGESRTSMIRILDAALTDSLSAIAHHRHAIRRELASRLKQVLRSSITDIGAHITDARVAGSDELAERLESDRQTVRIVMSTIDAVVNRLLQDELTAAASSQTCSFSPSGFARPYNICTPNSSTSVDE